MEKLAFVWLRMCTFRVEVRVGDTCVMFSVLIKCSLRSFNGIIAWSITNLVSANQKS